MEPQFDKTQNVGLKHFVNSARFSFAWLRHAYKHEAAFRQELFAFALLLPCAFWVTQDRFISAVLIAANLIVIAIELLNSSLEAVVDRTGLEHHPLARAAKDCGSAAVFVTLLAAGLLWSAALAQFFLEQV
ncbi:MAG: diacylglycerol kinase [Pseudomonadales bacterium]